MGDIVNVRSANSICVALWDLGFLRALCGSENSKALRPDEPKDGAFKTAAPLCVSVVN